MSREGNHQSPHGSELVLGWRPRSILRHLGPPLVVALVVGTLLCWVNGSFANSEKGSIVLNYLIPFVVATWSRFTLLLKIQKYLNSGDS